MIGAWSGIVERRAVPRRPPEEFRHEHTECSECGPPSELDRIGRDQAMNSDEDARECRTDQCRRSPPPRRYRACLRYCGNQKWNEHAVGRARKQSVVAKRSRDSRSRGSGVRGGRLVRGILRWSPRTVRTELGHRPIWSGELPCGHRPHYSPKQLMLSRRERIPTTFPKGLSHGEFGRIRKSDPANRSHR